MKCPDCGSYLQEVKFDETSTAHRCFKCGGFWTDSWAANRITSATLSKWRRISIDESWLSGGKGVCPQDGTILQRFVGDAVPPQLPVSRCIRCGKWWFPRDTLFEYKPAAEAKVNYFRLWGRTADLGSMVLPVVSILVMLSGLLMGLGLLRMRQMTQVAAAPEVQEVAIMTMGEAETAISFRSKDVVESVFIRKDGEDKWQEVKLAQSVSDTYLVRFAGLENGRLYIVRIGDEDYQFVAGR